MKCPKCKYHTSCLRSIIEHNAHCMGATSELTVPQMPLDQEMHCICGFSTIEGNALARHLVTCGRRSAYPTVEAAQENTVKRNMLDMLGLVRRDEDEEEDEATGDSSLLQPATDASLEIGAPPPLVEEEQSDEVAASTDEPMDVAEGDSAVVEEAHSQFNTELSLDDLAGPASVAPAPLAEPDRTPQLSGEYQSLATPRIAIPIEGDVDHVQKAQIEDFMESL